MKKFRLIHLCWIMPLVVILSFGTYLITNLITNNFHAVIPGKVYRSAQLQPNVLQGLTNKYHFKSIINLRGPHPDSSWYVSELKVSHQNRIHHYNIILPAHGLATKQELRKLVLTISSAQKPMLIHCREGADRTGLASSIAVILSGNKNSHYAISQVSWYYNVLSPDTVGYQILNNYFNWLKLNKLPFGKNSFLEWINANTPLRQHHGFFI
jgi:protein tyrosine phosphatase (PTP) superfamily phosphohydrolase (DUF442 family)